MNLFSFARVLSNSDIAETTGAIGGEESLGWLEMIKRMISDADPMNFFESLRYMGAGMLGIFLVMGILIAGTAVLNKVTNLKPKNKG